MVTKKARIISNKEISLALLHIKETRYPLRGEVMFLLSFKAGLSAKEISSLTWSMITENSGEIGSILHLPYNPSTGKPGREIPLNNQLKQALIDLYNSYPYRPSQDHC